MNVCTYLEYHQSQDVCHLFPHGREKEEVLLEENAENQLALDREKRKKRISYYIILYSIMLYYIIVYHIIFYYIISHNIILCYITLFHVILHDITLQYIIIYYII